jgi:hypothetical protein
MKLCQIIFPLPSEANVLSEKDDSSSREAKHSKIKNDGALFFSKCKLFSLRNDFFFCNTAVRLSPKMMRVTPRTSFLPGAGERFSEKNGRALGRLSETPMTTRHYLIRIWNVSQARRRLNPADAPDATQHGSPHNSLPPNDDAPRNWALSSFALNLRLFQKTMRRFWASLCHHLHNFSVQSIRSFLCESSDDATGMNGFQTFTRRAKLGIIALEFHEPEKPKY